MVDLTFEI